MSFISHLFKGYRTDIPITTKEYIENKSLQGNKTIASVKNRNEFVEDVDISFPNLWYMFNNSNKLKNYGVQQANYDTDKSFISNDLTDSATHMNYSGQGITELNKNIIQEFENDFTLSLWCKGNGVLFKIHNGTSDYIKIDIGTNSLLLNGTSIGDNVTIDTTAYNHILITKEYVYVNNTQSFNISLPDYTFNYADDKLLLDTGIEYYDMRIFNKILAEDKITKLYNLGTTINTYSTLGVSGTYNKKVDKFNINVSGENAMSLAFWIDSSNANIDIISFDDFTVGIKGKRFYTQTFGKNKVFNNRKLKDESKYYFVCVSIENDGSSHTVKLYVDNFPVTGNSFKTAFTFNNFINISGNNIENLVIYKRVLDDIEVMDLFIRDIKTNETTDDNLNSLAYLFSDYSKDIDSTEPDTTYNLQLYSTYNLVEVEGGGGTTQETNKYDIYKYKFNKYPGYQEFKNDLYAWYKFEKASTEPITSIAPNMIDSSNVYLAFKHDDSTFLIDFEPYTTNATWTNYADSLISDGLVEGYNFNSIHTTANQLFVIGGSPTGYIDFIIPSGYNTCDITYGNANPNTGAVILSINGQNVDQIDTTSSKTYTATNIVANQTIRISETVSGINYIIKLFYYNSQTSYTVNFPEDTTCDILIVGGGGGGGTVEYTATSATGGGGGGGGVIFLQNQTVSSGTYIIKVGKGGKGDDFNDDTEKTGQNGYNSSFSYLYTEAIGGGGGGSRTDHDPGQSNRNDNNTQGKTGGSGGGSSHGNSVTSTMSGGLGTISDILLADQTTVLITNYRQGYDAGTVQYESPYSSGGGGAGGNGNDSSGTDDGNGGIGRAEENGVDFKTYFNMGSGIGEHHTDSKVYFAGGGSSGYRNNDSNHSNGGLGGGGSSNNGISQNGVANTGGGGGGARSGDGGTLQNGGNGGSGIVIIRYSSTKTLENAIDSTTNKLQIPAGSVITKTIGTFSPYSLYWDGDLNDNTDNSYLTSSLSNLTPPLSISFWKKQDKLVSEETLSITDKLSLSINSNLAVKFSVGSTTEIIENQADLDWHFWTITSDGSSNQLYRDGRVLGSVITESLTLSATDELMIGSNLLGQNDASPSYLEDLRIWKKSLTHPQIIDCMSIYPGYKNHANDLYLWYKFEDHPWNTSTIKDYSGDKRDGTITNYVSAGTLPKPNIDVDYTTGITTMTQWITKGQTELLNFAHNFNNSGPLPSDYYGLYSGADGWMRFEIPQGYRGMQVMFRTWDRVSSHPDLNVYMYILDQPNTTFENSQFDSLEPVATSFGRPVGATTDPDFVTVTLTKPDFKEGQVVYLVEDNGIIDYKMRIQFYNNTLSRQQGRISPYAYFFNGSTADDTDNAYITKDTITDFPATFSIAFWKKCLDKSVEGKSFVLSTASTNVIEIDVSNTVNFTVGDSSNILEDYNDVSWHHWVFTYSGTEMDIYKDGMNRVGHMINKKTELTEFDVTAGDTIYVGGYEYGDASPSYLEDFRIYNKVLSGIEIQQIYSEWTGYIVDKKDNLKLWYQLNNNPVGIPDYPIFAGHESNLVAWYKFDDATNIGLDSSGTMNLTNSGVSIVNDSRGSVAHFNNAGYDRLTLTSANVPWNSWMNENGFSITLWFKIETTIAWNSFFWSQTGAVSRIMFRRYNNENKIEFDVINNTKASTCKLTSPIITNFENTYHQAVISFLQNDAKMYIDGIVVDTTTTASIDLSDTDNYIIIGDISHLSRGHSGNIDDFRIYDKALSETEIKQIYGDRSKFDNGYVYNYANTSPYFDGVLKNVLKNTNSLDGYPGYKDHENDLVAWYKFDDPNSLKDETGNYPLTNNGSVSFSTDTKIIGSSSYFPNSDNNGFLNITGGINLYDIWNGNGISFCIWYKVNLNESDIAGRIFEFGNTNQHLIWMAVQLNGTGDNTISLYTKGGHTGGNGPTIFVGNGTLDNNWHHIVWIVDINSDWYCYVDGINQNITANWDIPNITGGYTTNRLGKSIYKSDATQDLKGYLDDFRIYDKALSDFEVKQIYSGYTVSREKGHVSPYSYYWNGSTTDNNDNAYIEATGTATPMTDITDENSMTISYYKKLEGTVSKNASLSPDFNILSGSTNRISVGVNMIYEMFEYSDTREDKGLYTWTKPTGLKEVTAYVWGAGGGGSDNHTAHSTKFAGGSGAFIKCKINLNNLNALNILVGEGGKYKYGSRTFVGGGIGANNGVMSDRQTPSGGGLTGIFTTNNFVITTNELSQTAEAVVIAGSGGSGGNSYITTQKLEGGGGGNGNIWTSTAQDLNNKGRDGGSSNSGTTTNYDGQNGKGGSFEATINKGSGGAVNGTDGTQYTGGNGSDEPPGGGAGWFGGGGGSRGNTTYGGGGGGSSYWGHSSIIYITDIGGNNGTNTPDITSAPITNSLVSFTIPTNIGYGGKYKSNDNNNNNGGNGLIIIEYSKQHIKLNDTSYETNVAFDLNVWYRWTFTYDGSDAKIYMMNIGNTALTPISQELTTTFSGWTDDETFDKVLIGGGKTNLTNGLIAHYKFDGDLTNSVVGSSIGTLLEESGSTAVTFPNETELNYNRSAYVNNTVLTIPDFHFNNLIEGPTKSFTISFWFKPGSISNTWNILFDSSDYTYIDEGSSGTSYNSGIRVYLNNNNYIYIYTYDGSSNEDFRYALEGDFTDEIWRFYTFVWTYKSVSESVYTYDFRFYENSVLNAKTDSSGTIGTGVDEQTIANNNKITIDNNNFEIGGDKEYTTNQYKNIGYYSDFRIYNRALTSTDVNILYNNSLPDASPAYLEDIRMYNTSFTEEDVKNLSLYNIPTTQEPREVTINTVIGNQSVTAYEWSNLEKSDSLHLSKLYMNINNGKDLINKFYTGFEFSTTYWCKFDGTVPSYEIKLGSTEHTILELKQNTDIDDLLELSLDITNDSNQILTTSINEPLSTNHWYLVAITAGISDKYVSLSLALYDSSFNGTQDSYISSSVLVPQVDDYKYDINKYTNNFQINAVKYGDVRYYNKFITLVDIYNILTGSKPTADTLTDTLTLSGPTATVSLIGDSTISTDPVSFTINLDSEVYKLTGVDSLDNLFTNTSSTSSSVQTIKIFKGTQLTLNVFSSSAHPFIIVKSNVNPPRTPGNDSNRYTTDVTYDETAEKYNSGQISGDVVWDTSNSDLGFYYGICINHTAMYFIIELTTGSESTITTASSENINQVNIDKYYRINMSFSYSKNDLALTNDATDITIRSDTKTYLKFVAGFQPKLELYGDTDQLITTAYDLRENVWYDFYVTLKYDGTDTTGEIYIGKDKKIDYSTNYTKAEFIPFKGLDSTDDSLEVRIGVNKDEDPVKLDKKIENINIYTKKLNKYTINNFITNNVIAVVQPATTVSTSSNATTTVESNKLELWYRLSDFTNGEFNNTITDSSGKGRSGTATGNSPTQQITNNKNINKSYKLLKNNLKAMKITDNNFNISTPAITLTNNFSIMIKAKLELGSEKHNIFTYNDLAVDISSTELKVMYGGTSEPETIAYTFEDKWYAISLTYKKSRSLLSIYINEELQNKYSDVSIAVLTNILKLTDYSSKTPPSTIKLALEDLRVFSNEVNYSTIYEYANGINIT